MSSLSFTCFDTNDKNLSICSVLEPEYILHETIPSSKSIHSTSSQAKRKEKSVSEPSLPLREKSKRRCVQTATELDSPDLEVSTELAPIVQDSTETEPPMPSEPEPVVACHVIMLK